MNKVILTDLNFFLSKKLTITGYSAKRIIYECMDVAQLPHKSNHGEHLFTVKLSEDLKIAPFRRGKI